MKNTGIYNKFTVYRNDGRDQPGGDRDNAEYFVLDIANDKFARDALWTYANVCSIEYPELAQNLYKMVNKHEKKRKSDQPLKNWYYVVDECGDRQSVYFESYYEAVDFLVDCGIEGDQLMRVLYEYNETTSSKP